MSSQRFKKPDWMFWRDIVDVELWQAIYLSLDIDPRPRRNSDESLRWAPSDKYEDRLAIAASHLGTDKLPARSVAGDRRNSQIKLTDFAAFAISKGWKIPKGLADLAVEPAKAAPQKGKRVDPRVDNTRLIAVATLLELGKFDVSDDTKLARDMARAAKAMGSHA